MRSAIRMIVLMMLACGALGVTAGEGQEIQQQAPYRLTLQDAIQKGLQANLNVLLAGAKVDEAEGTRARLFSAALLPRVNAEVYANLQNRDLQAFGISVPGIPNVVGPFSNYDFRVYAQQNIVDLASLREFKASERSLNAGRLDDKDARDLIVRAIAAQYLSAESSSAYAVAAQSQGQRLHRAVQAGKGQARCGDGNGCGCTSRSSSIGQR